MDVLPLAWTRAGRGLRLGLMVLLMGAMVAATGCSWMKGKKDKGQIVKPPVENQTTAKTVDNDAPKDSEPEGPRAGSLLPFPELQVIYFDFDKDSIRPDQLPRIENNLQYLLAHPEDKVMIEGHCDERGTAEYNFNLGWRRAQAIKDYYVKNGVTESRIATVSKGEEEPVDLGKTEEAYQKNRRGEFKRMY